jgi:dimeric dUTPase (all-alpha-NTP-PPase superfamily)
MGRQVRFNTLKGYDLSEPNMKMLYQMCVYMNQEVAEVMKEIEPEWKNWKSQAKFGDIEAIREEVVDVLHFAINMALACGMDPDVLYDRFVRKNSVNFLRANSSY